MRKLIFLGLLIASPLHAAAPGTLTLVVAGKERDFTLAELRKKLKVVTVTIDDPVYKAKKSFDGFVLSEVLALGGLSAGDRGDELVFTATDGYAPNTSFSTLKEHEAVLA